LYVIAQIEKSGLGGSAAKAENLIDKEPFKTVSGKNIPHGETYVRRAWKRHHSVSHLWAAQRIFRHIYDPNVWPLDNPKEFLQVSEYFRWFGALHTAGNTGIPTLDPNATWKPPEAFPLDEILIEIPELSETGRLWVKEYLQLKGFE